jgi:hypothetical protein
MTVSQPRMRQGMLPVAIVALIFGFALVSSRPPVAKADDMQCTTEAFAASGASVSVDSAAGAASSYGDIYDTDALAFSGALADMGQKFAAYYTAVATNTNILSASSALVTAFDVERSSYLTLSGSELPLNAALLTLSGALSDYQSANDAYMACAYPDAIITASGSMDLPEEPTYSTIGSFDGTSSCDDLKTIIEETKADIAKANVYIAMLEIQLRYIYGLEMSTDKEITRLQSIRDGKILLNMWVDPDKTTITNAILSNQANSKGLYRMYGDLFKVKLAAEIDRLNKQKQLDAAELLWKQKPCMVNHDTGGEE